MSYVKLLNFFVAFSTKQKFVAFSTNSFLRGAEVGKGFPGGSDGRESACSAGDLGLICGLGRYPGERNSSPL